MTEDHDPAIRSLRTAVAALPGDAALHTLLGEKLLESARAEEAVEEYRNALRLDAVREDAALGLVRALSATGRDMDALAVLDGLAQISRPSAATLTERSRRLLAAGRPVPAAEQYRRAIALDPQLVDELLARRLGVQPAQPGAETVAEGRERVLASPPAVHDLAPILAAEGPHWRWALAEARRPA